MPGTSAPLGPELNGRPCDSGRRHSSSISRIGVTPKIGSLLNANAVDSAPISLPCTNTGEPLIPWATPLCTTRSDVARARMVVPSVRPPARVPTITASNESTAVPWKTVRTTAWSPGCRSSGARVTGEGNGSGPVRAGTGRAPATRAAATRLAAARRRARDGKAFTIRLYSRRWTRRQSTAATGFRFDAA